MQRPHFHSASSQGDRASLRAFTRADLVAAIGALGLLALLIAPAFATLDAPSERAACFNNLRLVGRGIAAWAGDHQQRVPWRTPAIPDGGTMSTPGNPKPGAAWLEYSFMSNTLITPKILACPSDRGVRGAASFAEYRSAGFRQNSTSYNLNLEVYPEGAGVWVSGDLNMRRDSISGCSAGIGNAAAINRSHGTSLAWTNAIHGANSGHLLLNDGGVLFTDTITLREIALRVDENGNAHFLGAKQ